LIQYILMRISHKRAVHDWTAIFSFSHSRTPPSRFLFPLLMFCFQKIRILYSTHCLLTCSQAGRISKRNSGGTVMEINSGDELKPLSFCILRLGFVLVQLPALVGYFSLKFIFRVLLIWAIPSSRVAKEKIEISTNAGLRGVLIGKTTSLLCHFGFTEIFVRFCQCCRGSYFKVILFSVSNSWRKPS